MLNNIVNNLYETVGTRISDEFIDSENKIDNEIEDFASNISRIYCYEILRDLGITEINGNVVDVANEKLLQYIKDEGIYNEFYLKLKEVKEDI